MNFASLMSRVRCSSPQHFLELALTLMFWMILPLVADGGHVEGCCPGFPLGYRGLARRGLAQEGETVEIVEAS